MEVQLIIKSPYQVAEDIKMDCDMSWSVGKVKEHLSSLYPGKPRIEDQKLIYCGRLLLDHLQLKDILSQQPQTVHTMHLVCPFPVCLDANGTSSKTSSDPIVGARFDSEQNHVEGLRNRFDNYIPLHPVYGVPQVNATMPMPNPPLPDAVSQITAMQQMYAQMMAQYFTQAQAGIGNFQYMPFSPTPAVMAPQQPTASIPAADIQEQPANGNALAYAQEQQPQNNAEEEVAAQDLLDWIYIMSRTMILVTILYFYSSLHRVLLVLSLGVLFFVYRAGVFERRQRRIHSTHVQAAIDRANGTQVARAENDPAENEDTNSENNTSHDNETSEDDAAEPEPEPDAPVTSEPEPLRRVSQNPLQSLLSVVITFVTTFFTSLIPEQPVPVNAN